MTLQKIFSTRISHHTSPGKPKRWCGLQGEGVMQLVEFTIVEPELGIASTFASYSHMSKAHNHSSIFRLSMEFSIQPAKLHVWPWGSLRMMETGASASQKHAKSKLVPQFVDYLQSYWPTMPQHTPRSCGCNSIGRCVMIF